MPKTHIPGQLGFDALLSDAAEQNRAREFERETGHLPSTMEEALPFFCSLLEEHHAAMIGADIDRVFELREEARKLALRLGGGDPGILANSVAPACVLTERTTAAIGNIPLWGQAGTFVVEAAGTKARIKMDGIFGIGSLYCYWPGFSATCVDAEKPFISGTGYRRFIGLQAGATAGITPDKFTRVVLEAHVSREMKGRLVAVDEQYRRERDQVD